MRKWYEVKAQADGESADIYIVDFIGDWIDDMWGFGVTSKQFLRELQDLPKSIKTLRVHVNSPGGDVVSATHIANMLRDMRQNGRNVEVSIEGAAWSAATIITSAGSPTRIADNALMFVHKPWTVTIGNADELRKEAAAMDKFGDSIVATYRWKSPLSEGDLLSLMAAETWMDADEAVANGFADEKIEGVQVAAAFSPRLLARAKISPPEKYRERVQAMMKKDPDDASSAQTQGMEEAKKAAMDKGRLEGEEAARRTAKEIYSLCAKAGVPDAAAEYLNRNMTVEQVAERLADAQGIRDACAAARLPERAAGYIRAGMTLKEVRAELFDVLKARQGSEIDNKLGPDIDPVTRKKSIDWSKTYSLRNQAANRR